MNHAMTTTTTLGFEGYCIVRTRGIVREITVRSRDVMQGVTEVLCYGTGVVIERA
jgi:uncharacterized protein YbjQ (UPF0145 family)